MTAKVQKGVKDKVLVTATDKVNLLLPKTENGDITRKTEWNSDITAPVKKGDVLGNVRVYMGEKEVGKIPIVANETVEKLNLFVTFKWILNGLLSF